MRVYEIIKTLQALHYVPPLHLYPASAITLSKMRQICVRFHGNISNGFQLIERTCVHGRNGYVQCSKGNAITRNVGKPELRLIGSVCGLMVLFICVKVRENITNCIRVMERTRVHGRSGYVQCSKGNNSISRPTRVTVHMFCTLSRGALHWCVVS